LTLYWKRCTTQGVLVGIIGGTLTAVVLVLVSPNMTYPAMARSTALERARESLLTRDRRAEARWSEMVVRRETGYGIAAAIDH
jgi:cation/acetate symporter